jgi:hypothetical protein
MEHRLGARGGPESSRPRRGKEKEPPVAEPLLE